MSPVLTAAQMYLADQQTIDTFGLPSLTLMETASRGACAAVEARFGAWSRKRVVVLAGKGNNGGDGLVMARVAYTRGAHVTVVQFGDRKGMTEGTHHNAALLDTLAEHDAEGRLRLRHASATPTDVLGAADVIIDAMLGIGLSSPVRQPMRGWVDAVNALSIPVVAVDIPSGLHADTGAVLGAAVRASLTVTMAAHKAGLLMGRGPDHTGEVVVADIGIPPYIMADVQAEAPMYRITDTLVRGWLPERRRDGHKFTSGTVLTVAGSPGLTGAPIMTATAAARAGAGYVICACPESVRPVLAARFTEIMTLGLPVGEEGIDRGAAQAVLADKLARADVLLVGPGLGRAPQTSAFVRSFLGQSTLPCVLDADGLNAFIGHTNQLAACSQGRWLLTPHDGEFKRLAGADVNLTDRIATARRYAAKWNATLLLKGNPSVIADPGGTVYIATAQSPSLATAGTGDVLSGISAGLIAQGCAPLHAAVCALHLTGRAAQAYTAAHPPNTMLATDLLSWLPGAWLDVTEAP
ncbi:MAG: NAD(P)H-hydrate dehydratase [Bacteroidota bacterium]